MKLELSLSKAFTRLSELVKARGFAPRAFSSIYPIRLPEIEVEAGLDFLLLDLPASYALFRVGFGYVHEILKRQRIRHQTIDLNMILYHRFHMHRILDHPGVLRTASGQELPADPWGALEIDLWSSPDMVEYFRADIEKLLGEIERARPTMVGISLQTGNRLFAVEVVQGIRRRSPDTLIVVGGFDCVHVEFGPKIFPDFDYMVIGEAERTLPVLVERVLAGEKPQDLPGIVSRFDSPGRVWQAPPLENDLDRLPFPTYDWADLPLYRNWSGAYTAEIAINRGCKWSRCTFCNECFPWRKRSPGMVVDEIQWFADRGCRFFNFSVSDAVGDSVTLSAIAREIVLRNLKAKTAARLNCNIRNIVQSCKAVWRDNRITINTQLRIDKRSDYDFFKTLHAAGFIHLSFGVDGWTNRLLRMQNKGYTFALVAQNLRDAHRAGIRVSVNLVLGIPGETQDDVIESIHNILSLKDAIDSFNSIYPLMLAPGSNYYNNPEAYRIKFRGDKNEIYERHPYLIPPGLWYSEEPFIDHAVRIERISFLRQHLAAHQVKIDDHVIYMLNKLIAKQGMY